MSADPLPLERLAPRRVLVDEVAQAVRNLLMDQTIKPGQSLIIGRLAEALGVSHTPVREALARLESEGLVVKRPQRGYFATELLTTDEMIELFELRLLLEPWAAAQVAAAARHIDVSGLRAELTRFTSALRSGPESPYRLLCDHDIRFHGLLMELCGNRQVARAFERTHCHLHLLRVQSRASKADVTVAEHEAIVTAIERRDVDGAAEAMRRHLNEACKRAITLRDEG
ncbi:GntR family transcriptional regulator [Thermasporomyces composti]|uniref:DNA-binding GntR family transcriptional regulator n=1 Tax=Thermasporomyces composti TaxID=696763 RepID=A0A3D9V606_THECX|nr:GntR family transcriptional regulator [Thermasporomyces composti]REF37198.1 DNA-binding GntR family transcriptional regulator [Thermasporomyces composti]